LATSSGKDPQPLRAAPESHLPPGTAAIMCDDKLIDFAAERDKRIHDLHDKRLNEVRDAFAQALPLSKAKKKPKSKPKKR
jgi:hypothetical protein